MLVVKLFLIFFYDCVYLYEKLYQRKAHLFLPSLAIHITKCSFFTGILIEQHTYFQ